ncbi:hypothetical protein HNO88_000721 [Novosphingobium chloroacetimidivorans]|uniref:Uncharacterized protein n=1 Tax=Novosphingobium chloroacetimidivorans TaxID=1428314 RepID=A0A7W7K704_9SPHN|nr:hypothetical protein [Novosphingobium chloroacetimidivorans]
MGGLCKEQASVHDASCGQKRRRHAECRSRMHAQAGLTDGQRQRRDGRAVNDLGPRTARSRNDRQTGGRIAVARAASILPCDGDEHAGPGMINFGREDGRSSRPRRCWSDREAGGEGADARVASLLPCDGRAQVVSGAIHSGQYVGRSLLASRQCQPLRRSFVNRPAKRSFKLRSLLDQPGPAAKAGELRASRLVGMGGAAILIVSKAAT